MSGCELGNETRLVATDTIMVKAMSRPVIVTGWLLFTAHNIVTLALSTRQYTSIVRDGKS